jgi:Leucine-rich repeat (LRR) protein
MEDDDEMIPELDDKGHLVLSNRGWVHLDPVIWSMSLNLVKLDITYNHLTEIPPQMGDLVLLRELIASFNKIVTIPPELGKLRRLRKLALNNNRIKGLPTEIGNMEMLEELILGENMIEEIPASVARIPSLKVLKMTNNRLRSIPFEIAYVFTLVEFDCGNNPHLETVPAHWRGDTESLLFTCRMYRDFHIQTAELNNANADLSRHAQFIEQDNFLLKEKITEMQLKIDELYRNIPKKVVKRIEADAKRQAEQELLNETEALNKKTRCIIS